MSVDRHAQSTHPRGVAGRYEALIARGKIERDAAQDQVAQKLDSLAAAVERTAWFKLDVDCFIGHSGAREHKQGLYLHGPVGGGKTLMMDLLFESVEIAAKRRIHFHAFMLEIHERLRDARAGGARDEPISHVVRSIAREARLLCLDELFVVDIADAMILSRLFAALFARGVAIVATSNVAPEDLYRDGINRSRFIPFIALLRESVDVVRLEARTDFRREKHTAGRVWHVPADAVAKAALDRAFEAASGGAVATPLTLQVKGRRLVVPHQAAGVARFDFRNLCAAFLGAADYMAIAGRFHTLVVDDIPVLDFERRKHAKRFSTLVDILHQRHVKLIASAAAEPDNLFVGGSGPEADEFPRTASRLIEMGSQDYQGAGALARR